jgi:hypothetical protein
VEIEKEAAMRCTENWYSFGGSNLFDLKTGFGTGYHGTTHTDSWLVRNSYRCRHRTAGCVFTVLAIQAEGNSFNRTLHSDSAK